MSLRTEIRAALEEFAPPAPHLDRDVRDTLHALQRPLLVARRPMPRLRVSLSLVAAAIIVALMAGLVLAGRQLVQSNTPAWPSHVINQAEVKSLEARPLQLPAVPTGAACPEGPLTTDAPYPGPPFAYGGGPVYASKGERGMDSWGTWAVVTYTIDPRYSGIMLVRARDLRTGQSIVFADFPRNTGSHAEYTAPGVPTGTRAGTHYDPVWNQTVKVYSEFVILPPGPAFQGPGWPGSFATVGIPGSASGCVGFQVDGSGFTEVYVVDELA